MPGGMYTASFARGDARSLPLRDGIASTVITSPPYWGLRIYEDQAGDALGLESDVDAYVLNLMRACDEMKRVLRSDGTLWLVLGDTYHGPVRDPERSRFKNGAMSRGAEVNRANPGMTKSLALVPQRVMIALQERGWTIRAEIVWAKPNALPEPVKDRPVRAHETIILAAKRPRYYFNHEALREPSVSGVPGSGNVQRAPTRGSVKGRMANVPWKNEGWRNGRTIWQINSVRVPGHSAVFPDELARRCIAAGSREGDLVIDPFNGSGTVPRVASRMGRRGLGIDVSLHYLELATELTRDDSQERLF